MNTESYRRFEFDNKYSLQKMPKNSVPQEFSFPALKSLEAQRHTIDTSCTQPSKLICIFPFSIPHQIFPGKKKKKDVLLQCLFLCIQYMYNLKLYNDKFYEHL